MINLKTYGWNDKLNQLKLQSMYGSLAHVSFTVSVVVSMRAT